MFSRILFSSLAAVTLVTATPTLAADRGTTKDPCSCCSDGSVHDVDHPLRQGQKQKTAPDRGAQQPYTQDDPFIRNQSFGG